MIDLSSDTATRPTEGMRRAMAAAPVGDEQRHEDPTTSRLAEQGARLLGKAASVFLPSATMSNAVALRTHVRPGDEIIADARAHIAVSEGGGYAALAGAALQPLQTERGVFSGAQLTRAVRPDDPHYPRTRLVCVENTHNAGGGTIWTIPELEEVARAARAHGLSLHLDGARLLNAAVASGRPAAELAAHFDSVTLCLSKGLGCPAGALLAGPEPFIAAAWRSKHLLGGAMRQSGILAAAGLYALEHHVSRLAADHAHARRLAQGLAGIKRVQIDPARVESNIVFFRVDGLPAEEARERLAAQGVRLSGAGDRIRAVTHGDISGPEIDRAIAAAQAAWA